MASKNNPAIDVNECNMDVSSPTHNNEFINNSDGVQENLSSPERGAFLSDAYVAKLLSHTGRAAHSPNKICDKSQNTGQNNSISVLEMHLELKDTSTKCEDSLQMKSINEQENQNNSSHLLLEDTSSLQSELKVSSTKNEDFPELNGSPDIESLEVIDEKNIQMESNQVDMDKEKKEETPSLLTMEAVEKHNENKPSYRGEESWTEDDDSSSTFSLNSSSDCSDSFLEKMQNNVNMTVSRIITTKTKGELDIDDLPPIQDLNININESEIEQVGKIHAIVEKLAIVQSMKNLQPLDLDSVLFLTSEKPLGRIFDVFGPVSEPFYSVRFNSRDDIKNNGISVGIDVFYAPGKEDITTYVFLDELKKQKGSDASWKDNNEPPEECIDYSDDEQERAAKQKRRGKTRPKPFDDEDQSSEKDYPVPVTSNDSITTVSSTYNSFHSTSSNTSNTRMPNRLSMATVMTSAYKPNVPWSPKRYQGQPIITPVRPANPFRDTSYATNLNQAAGQMRNLTSNPQTPEIKFCPPQTFVSQPQQSFISAPPVSLSYPPPPSQPVFQFRQSPGPQPVRFQAFCPPPQPVPQQQGPFQQPHVFGQMTPFGSISPAFQQSPAIRFAPPQVMSPPPFVSVPPASPNFSYFSHNYAPAPSPPTQGHIAPNSPWFQGQAASGPRALRFVAPLSPLSIQIPNNLRTPPPTMPVPPAVNVFNGVSSIQSPHNMGPYIQHPGTGTYRY